MFHGASHRPPEIVVSVIHRMAHPMWTRRNIFRVVFLLGILVVPLALNWTNDGPSSDKAFWIVVEYFVEILIWGLVEVGGEMVRRSRSDG
jgi:hypothetical protein